MAYAIDENTKAMVPVYPATDTYTESEVNNLLSGKSNNGHTHDDRYYTKSEMNNLLGNKSNILLVENKSKWITASANSSAGETFDITKDGYTPIGVVGVDSEADKLYITSFFVSNNSATIYIKNVTSSEITTGVYIRVLYIKN